MKAQKSKIFLTIALTAIVVLTAVFAFSSCQKTEHIHTFNEVVVAEATCTEAGKLNKVCTDEACGYVESIAIPATGHKKTNVPAKAPTCTSVGYVAHIKCTACDWTTLDNSGIKDRLDHDTVLVDDRQKSSPEYDLKYPTCTESGYHFEYYECWDCENNFDPVKVIDAPLGHNIVKVDARAASCNIGWDAFEYCCGWDDYELSQKGYPYMDSIDTSGPAICDTGCGYNTYVEHDAIYGHVWASELEYVEVKAATCESEGKYQLVQKCTTCRVSPAMPSWSDKKPAAVIVEEGSIPALGHEWQKHEANMPKDCYTDGWEEFRMCSRCSKIDTPDGKIPVIQAGHKYGDGTNQCLLVCTVCDYVDMDSGRGGHTITVDVKITKEPTCTDNGFYECTKFCDYCKKVITKETVAISAHGHDIIEHVAKAETCTTVGWDAFQTCSRCEWTNFVQKPEWGHTPDTANPITTSKKEATCTEAGMHYYVYKCTVCNEVAESYEIELPIIPHTVVTVAEKPATCDQEGHAAYDYCGECGKFLSVKRTYSALGHQLEQKDAKAPTCTETGWYQYAVCTRDNCGYNTKEASMRPALGHSIKTDVVVVPVTCTTDATYTATSYCTVCGVVTANDHKVTELALGHTYLENGHCERYSQCGERYSVGLAYYKNADGTYTVAGRGSCTDAEIIIPAEYNGAKIVAIADEAFIQDQNLTSFKTGKNVTEIGQKAFFYCKNLKTVTIGESVTKVGINAFNKCAAITKTYYTGSNWGAIDFTQWNDDLTSKY